MLTAVRSSSMRRRQFICRYCLLFQQAYLHVLLPSPDTQEMLIKHYVIATFALKVVDIGHLLISQMSADIFLLDWERPKPNLKGGAGGGDAQPTSSVSVWRTYLIANEWNELQSIRKTSLTLQIISVVFILKVCGLEHLATGSR